MSLCLLRIVNVTSSLDIQEVSLENNLMSRFVPWSADIWPRYILERSREARGGLDEGVGGTCQIFGGDQSWGRRRALGKTNSQFCIL
jgi:hypothetical protein